MELRQELNRALGVCDWSLVSLLNFFTEKVNQSNSDEEEEDEEDEEEEYEEEECGETANPTCFGSA